MWVGGDESVTLSASAGRALVLPLCAAELERDRLLRGVPLVLVAVLAEFELYCSPCDVKWVLVQLVW